ncbi:dipeptidase [Ruixingdingia sedimenti]|uniref:Dipeptidase n=1 Tax=Ruixingdingia sedimenti TaxID=3073604 RepID=A0ABU1F4B4_9RHOB|nr:dipeptidase [Xinfangfangia sp. LG-4]MDR5651700.1 dipeptidase [Xinfangfangia sp. LG-4]
MAPDVPPPAPPAPGPDSPAPRPVFDGHNDLLLHLWQAGDATGRGFFEGRAGHIDLARCRAGGMAGGFFAIWVPGQHGLPDAGAGLPPAFPPLGPDRARVVTLAMAGILVRMARARPDAIRLCTTAAQVEAARAAGAIGAVMHLEGAEAIGPDLAELEVLHAAGLRSIGPVWSRDNIFGQGVPFRFPSGPDIGGGLTEAGKRLVAECDRLGIMIDLSHLNEAGFWDVAAISDRPLVATHSCVHALCPSARNLTDRQLDAIAERGGVVGLNFAVQFLRPDGARDPDTAPDLLARHLAHLVDRLGEGGVALGSDYDGALTPRAVGGAEGLPVVIAAMRAAGFGEALVNRICWENWLGLVRRVIG